AGVENALHDLGGGLAARGLAVGAAHAGGQVVGADENRVDAGHGENGVGILDGGDVLALQHHENLVVGAGKVFVGGGVEVESVDGTADTAVADGRIFGGGDGGLGLLPAIDHGHDDAVSAVVENALAVIVAIGGDAGQGGAAGVGHRGEDVRGRLPVDQAVLDIHGEPGEAGASEEAGGRDVAQRQPGAYGRLAGSEGLFDGIFSHHVLVLTWRMLGRTIGWPGLSLRSSCLAHHTGTSKTQPRPPLISRSAEITMLGQPDALALARAALASASGWPLISTAWVSFR